MSSSPPEPKILYVAGNGRSATTLINQILGEIEGWFGAGELWLSGSGSVCGCGAKVDQCEFWGPIIKGFRQSSSRGNLLAVARERRRRAARRPPLLAHPELLTTVYRDIHQASGANVIVDVSNLLMPALLASLTECQLYVVHIVRDPRAFAYAWTKEKLRMPGGSSFQQWSSQKSSFRWLRRHAAIEVLLRRRLGSRYLLLRYEDFVARPLAAVRSICALVGEPHVELPFLDADTVRLRRNHNIEGNATRFLEGPVPIVDDEEWKAALPRRQALIATLIGAALMPRYRYPLLGTETRSGPDRSGQGSTPADRR
jgi:hypothetical protein